MFQLLSYPNVKIVVESIKIGINIKKIIDDSKRRDYFRDILKDSIKKSKERFVKDSFYSVTFNKLISHLDKDNFKANKIMISFWSTLSVYGEESELEKFFDEFLNQVSPVFSQGEKLSLDQIFTPQKKIEFLDYMLESLNDNLLNSLNQKEFLQLIFILNQTNQSAINQLKNLVKTLSRDISILEEVHDATILKIKENYNSHLEISKDENRIDIGWLHDQKKILTYEDFWSYLVFNIPQSKKNNDLNYLVKSITNSIIRNARDATDIRNHEYLLESLDFWIEYNPHGDYFYLEPEKSSSYYRENRIEMILSSMRKKRKNLYGRFPQSFRKLIKKNWVNNYLFINMLIERIPELVITGSGGSGKSTLLKYLEINYLLEGQKQIEEKIFSPYLPIRIELYEFSTLDQLPNSFEDYLVDIVKKKFGINRSEKLTFDVLQMNFELIILIDAVDEIVHPTKNETYRLLKFFFNNHSEIKKIITTRPISERIKNLGYSINLNISSITHEMAFCYISNYLSDLYSFTGDTENESRTKEIFDSIQTNNLLETVETYLLLSIYIKVLSDRSVLSRLKTKFGIMETITEWMYGRWDDIRKKLNIVDLDPSFYDVNFITLIINDVAFNSLSDSASTTQATGFDSNMLRRAIEKQINNLGVQLSSIQLTNLQRGLKEYLIERCGFKLINQDTDYFELAFPHRIFRDFSASKYISNFEEAKKYIEKAELDNLHMSIFPLLVGSFVFKQQPTYVSNLIESILLRVPSIDTKFTLMNQILPLVDNIKKYLNDTHFELMFDHRISDISNLEFGVIFTVTRIIFDKFLFNYYKSSKADKNLIRLLFLDWFLDNLEDYVYYETNEFKTESLSLIEAKLIDTLDQNSSKFGVNIKISPKYKNFEIDIFSETRFAHIVVIMLIKFYKLRTTGFFVYNVPYYHSPGLTELFDCDRPPMHIRIKNAPRSQNFLISTLVYSGLIGDRYFENISKTFSFTINLTFLKELQKSIQETIFKTRLDFTDDRIIGILIFILNNYIEDLSEVRKYYFFYLSVIVTYAEDIEDLFDQLLSHIENNEFRISNRDFISELSEYFENFRQCYMNNKAKNEDIIRSIFENAGKSFCYLRTIAKSQFIENITDDLHSKIISLGKNFGLKVSNSRIYFD